MVRGGCSEAQEDPGRESWHLSFWPSSGINLPSLVWASLSPLLTGMAILPLFQLVRRIMCMVTELCKGPSTPQIPQNGDNGSGQWIRKQDTGSEIRNPDSSPSCHQCCCGLGQAPSPSLGLRFLICEMTAMSLDNPFKSPSILMSWIQGGVEVAQVTEGISGN